MKLFIFVSLFLIKTVFTQESCNDFESEEDLRVTSWTTPVIVRKIEDSETLQEFVAMSKVDESKKDLKKIILKSDITRYFQSYKKKFT